jgi:hypothetical protein
MQKIKKFFVDHKETIVLGAFAISTTAIFIQRLELKSMYDYLQEQNLLEDYLHDYE